MKTKVVFKMETAGGWISPLAVFPDTAKCCRPGYVMTYARVGQHSEASAEYVASLRDATEKEAAPLAKELTELVGYDLDTVGLGVSRPRGRTFPYSKRDRIDLMIAETAGRIAALEREAREAGDDAKKRRRAWTRAERLERLADRLDSARTANTFYRMCTAYNVGQSEFFRKKLYDYGHGTD